MIRCWFALAVLLLVSGCGSGGNGGTGAADTASPSLGTYRLQVRIDTGVRAQAIGPASTITRVRVQLFTEGRQAEFRPALEASVGSSSTVQVAFESVPVGVYTLQASAFNAVGAVIAGPVSQTVTVTQGAPTQASLTLQVLPVEKDFLYAASENFIYVFESDRITGSLTPTASSPLPVPSGSRPDEIVAGADGRYLYCGYFGQNKVAQFEITPTTGDLTFIRTVNTGDIPSGMTADPQRRFLFVPNRLDATVGVFRIDPGNGALTEIADSPFAVAGSTNPQRAYTDPQGRFLFVTDAAFNGQLFVMRIDGDSGELTQTVGPFQAFPAVPASFRTYAVTTNPQGTILYVVGNFPELVVYDINQADGFLTQRDRITTVSTNLAEPVFDAQRNVLYVLGYSDNVIRIYQLDESGDVGAEIPGSPVSTGGQFPLVALLTPDGERLYLSNFDTNGQISAFLPDDNGLPVPVAGQPFPAGLGPFGLEFVTLQSYP